jgi:putative ABC transport system ATP-binding protein
MFWLSPSITLLMLSIVPPVSLGAVFYGRYLKRLSNRTQEALGDMSKVAQEALSAARTVQAFNAQPFEQRKFDAKVAEVLDLARKEAYATGIFFGSTGWSGNLTILALLGYGAWCCQVVIDTMLICTQVEARLLADSSPWVT